MRLKKQILSVTIQHFGVELLYGIWANYANNTVSLSKAVKTLR
jgi:hypothetical protein